MRKWFGVLGLLIILAAAFLIRLPVRSGNLTEFTGLLVSENVVEYPIIVEVVPYSNMTIGVALQNYELDFGILSQGMKARKTINLESPNVPVKVRAWADGDIAGMVGLSRSDFVLDGPGSIEVSVEAADLGNHTGRLFISARNPNYRWMGWITPWL
jgi:hypothetical protein